MAPVRNYEVYRFINNVGKYYETKRRQKLRRPQSERSLAGLVSDQKQNDINLKTTRDGGRMLPSEI
jgi:hypothetical protein